MAFLNSSRLLEVLPACIDPFLPKRVESGAYELSMGDEYFTTNTETATKKILQLGEQFSIEPGQFALLITKEYIKIPHDNLGFISIKAGIKFKGLINVSGFHVDPGFEGRLKFSVYNAGSRPITIEQGQRMFPLWLSEFTTPLSKDELYDGKFQGQEFISSEDVSKMAGVVMAPAVLDKRVTGLDGKFSALETSFANAKGFVATIGAIIITLAAKYAFDGPDKALEQGFIDVQKTVNIRLTKQDSTLRAQQSVIAVQDSTLQALRKRISKLPIIN